MKQTIIRTVAGSATVAVVVLGSAAPALAAKNHKRSQAGRHGTASTTSNTRETALTGSALSSASTAATTANQGATVNRASTENDSSLSGAAYEVHITKADGTHAVVIEDTNFNVLTTQADRGHGGH